MDALRACLALAVTLSLPAAAAGTPADPEVTDPIGDVSLQGLPVPVGLEWADLQAAWFEGGDGAVTLSIRVGGAQPPQGEVGVTFQSNGKHYIAGFTVLPGLYAGGFLSESDADGDVPASVTPASMPATWEGGLIEVQFPAEDVGAAPDAAATLAQPWAWSEARASNGETYRADRTAVGRDFTLAPASGPTPAPTTAPTDTSIPGPGALLPLLAAAALLRRRPPA